jgi:hypothetical protein
LALALAFGGQDGQSSAQHAERSLADRKASGDASERMTGEARCLLCADATLFEQPANERGFR